MEINNNNSSTNTSFHDKLYSEIINVLWISHHPLEGQMLDDLSDYIEKNYNTDCFGVRNYTDSYTKLLFDDANLDYSLICIDGNPWFLNDLFYRKHGVPILTYSKCEYDRGWHRYIPVVEEKKTEKKSLVFFVCACVAVFSLVMIPLKLMANRVDVESVVVNNLEHKMKESVELLDIEHLENDIYLARCYAGGKEFNAYLYYDTSTVRVDEGSYIDVPEGVEH